VEAAAGPAARRDGAAAAYAKIEVTQTMVDTHESITKRLNLRKASMLKGRTVKKGRYWINWRTVQWPTKVTMKAT